MAAQAAGSQAKHRIAGPSNNGIAMLDLAMQHDGSTVAARRTGVAWVHA